MKTKLCYFLTANGLTIGTSCLKVVRSLHTWCCNSRPETFSERCSSLWAQFRSNEVETLWPALHEVQTGWSDGLSDFKFYVFMLLEPRYLLRFLQSATPFQVYVSWSENVVWWAAEPPAPNGSSPSCFCQCGPVPSFELWHSSSLALSWFVSLNQQETILF